MSCDLKDFLLSLPMDLPGYMCINLKYSSPDIIQRCNPHKKSIKWWVFLHENQKIIYGLKQASVLAYNNFVKILLPVVMRLENTLQASGRIQQRGQKFASALMIIV